MIHGPDISVIQAAAKEAVMKHFVGVAESDGTPPTLRALYVLKVAEARVVLSGGTSDYINKEAALRGIEAADLANQIVSMSAQSEQLELARMQANVSIEAATDESGVHAVLDGLGLTVSVSA